jgi:type IV pilus assembly protein PilM
MGSMKKTQSLPLFFEDKPLFGLDIGRSTIRVLQVHRTKRHMPRVTGYGEAAFDPECIKDGVIVGYEKIADAINNLFKNNLIGAITTRRVALSLPVSRAFIRSINIPKLNEKELADAVKMEVEQYIPVPIENLYIDYSCMQRDTAQVTVFIVAMPKKIVDSYTMLAKILGLEAVLMQTSSGAGAKLFSYDSQSDLATVLVDFGSNSADISIFDHSPLVSGTVACGGEQITRLIQDALDVTEREANIIKCKYGLGFSKKQKQIEAALEPTLGVLLREIRRNIRYYEEHAKNKGSISQVVIMGGGANMPGLADYLTSALRTPVRSFDPTAYIDFGTLQPLNASDRMSYVTAAGLSLYSPHEVFAV